MAREDVKCNACGNRKTLALRGRWFRHIEEDGRQMMDVRAYPENIMVLAVRCAMCHHHFHVEEVIIHAHQGDEVAAQA